MPMLPGMVDGLGSQLMQRRQLYAGPMSKLRLLMICRMAKPEEVLIVEDENGNIVRETMKDNDVLVQYKIMRETLIYLAHLDHEDTEKQMLKKLSKQLNGEDWTWNNLNTLCWAIGSISGSMVEEQENRFLVMVIRDLLNLCEITKGKDNKAVIASNIMYVVGQYPRFLRAHWKFLKTVVNKFEFMHETHPGVQDMACDTFLKIVQKCKRKFVIVQVGENEPFVSELLTTLPATIADLEPHQIHSFMNPLYSDIPVAHMIQAESDPHKRDEYLQRLMELPNQIAVRLMHSLLQKWAEIIGQARQSVDFLKDPDVIRAVLNILQTNTSVASSLGTYFLPQISLIFLDMLNVYRMYSELISTSIAQEAPMLPGHPCETSTEIPQIWSLISFDLHIDTYFITSISTVDFVCPCAKSCYFWKPILNYPEHRLKFFSLLRAIATHCFPALIRLSSEQLKLVMDSIIWAFRHTERNIAETGLNLLLEMLKNFQVESGALTEPLWDVATVPYAYPNNGMFVREYTIKLLSTSFPNMTAAEVSQFVNGLFESRADLSIFKNHIRDFLVQSKEFSAQVIFLTLLYLSRRGKDQGLFYPEGISFQLNTPVLDRALVPLAFHLDGSFDGFLDNKDLYAEEAAAQRERERQRMLSIPGLIAPNEIQDEMVDS
ncbi:UNVERIFIED_CONTAM: protein EXPORTIN 1A [Sesamum angustifolium]|uniref:Protein EXPORTIN 1A n=1 Tax=Sesamum angustifolium TaxID=2727405 RepID=A0AAW2LHI6_9LAMI